MNIHRIINQMILNERDADQVGVLPSTTTKPKKPKTPSKEEGEFNPPPTLSLTDIESGRGNVALKAGLKNIEDEVAAGTLDRKTANDYKQQLMDRFGAGVKELEQLEKEKAVEKGLDTVANIAGMVPGPIGTAVDVAQAGSLLVRGAMASTPEEKEEYQKQAAITVGMGILAPPVVRLALKGAGKAAGKVATTVAPKTTKKITDVAATISKGGEKGSVPGQVAGGAGAFLASTAAGAGLATSFGAGLAGTYVGKMAGEILAKKFPGLVKDIGKGPKFIPGVPSSTVSKPSDKPEAPKPSAAVSKPSAKPEASKSVEEVPSSVPLTPSQQAKYIIKVPKENPTAFYDVNFNTKPGAVSKPSAKPEASKSVEEVPSSVPLTPSQQAKYIIKAPKENPTAFYDVNFNTKPSAKPEASKSVEEVPSAVPLAPSQQAKYIIKAPKTAFYDVDFNTKPSAAVSKPSDKPEASKSSVSSIRSNAAKIALSALLAVQSVGALPASVAPTKVSAPVATVQKAIQDVMNTAMTPIGAPKAPETVTAPKAPETVTAPKAPLSTGTVQKAIQDVINPSRAVSIPSDAPAKAEAPATAKAKVKAEAPATAKAKVKDEAPATAKAKVKDEAPATAKAKAEDEAPAKAEDEAPAKGKDEAPPKREFSPIPTRKIPIPPVIPPVIPIGSPQKPKQPELTSVVADPFGIKVRSNLTKFGDDDNRSSIGGRSGNDALIGYYNKLLTGGGR